VIIDRIDYYYQELIRDDVVVVVASGNGRVCIKLSIVTKWDMLMW
jgi:hypothetical protein